MVSAVVIILPRRDSSTPFFTSPHSTAQSEGSERASDQPTTRAPLPFLLFLAVAAAAPSAMESVHKSGGGSAPGGGAGAGAEGVLCHACGHQYPNGHPSAKQRRAHRKHCGKPASAAAEEHDGGESLLGEGAGGDGVGGGAAECGIGSPGSAPEAAGDSAREHSSGNGTGHQSIGDSTSAEECLISSSNIPSEVIPEVCTTDDDTLTTVATQYSQKVSPIEDGDPSDPAVGPEHLQHVPTSVISPEPEDCAKFSSEISEHSTQNPISEYETQNSTVVVLESNATGGGSSEQMSDVVRKADGIAVTDEDDMTSNIARNKSSEDNSVEGDRFGLSCQDNLQTEIDEEHSSITVEKDSAAKNLNVIHNEEIPRDDAESNQPSKDVLTRSFEKTPTIEEHVESSTEKSVGIEDGLLKIETSDADDVKPQQQPVSTSETADHLAVSKGADNVDEQRYPISEASIQAISSAVEPAIGGKVISVGSAANFTKVVCSSGVKNDDSMQKNVSSGMVVTSQNDLKELSTSTTASEINMVVSTNDVDEKSQDEKVGINLTSSEVGNMDIIESFEEKQQNKEVITDPSPHEVDDAVSGTDNHGENEQSEETMEDTSSCMLSAVQSMSIAEEKELSTSTMASEINMVVSTNDVDAKSQDEKVGINLTSSEVGNMHIIESFEEKQQNKEVIVDPSPHEVDAVSGTDNHGENEQSEETMGDTSSCMVSAVQSMSIAEEKEQIEEFIAHLASEEINVTSSRDIVEEKQCEIVKINHEIDGVRSIEATGENNANTCEINAGSVTDDIEDKMPNEEITTGTTSHGINMVDNSIDEEKVHNKEVTNTLGSCENIVFLEDKMYEDTSGPTPDKFSLGTSTDSAVEQKDETASAGPPSHETNVAHTTDKADEEKYMEPAVVSTSGINTMDNIGDVENKEQSEETTADPRSIENATSTQGTDDAENKQNEYTIAAGPSSNEAEVAVAQKTDAIEETEKAEDTASKEITTIESTDDMKGATDQNEEIADKEMVTDDKNHVSLKALLADKNVEPKEKEKKASAKDRVLSFRRLVSKDNVSPVKPGSPKAGSEQQDWNSPARLPVEKKPKGRKQQWVPFICCSSVQ
ncbi:hypothetical protein BS78_07G198900 [Paspalum vaginatum]|nr:hypothetical protein BS78_07G198900 [Paspalum vaginatum]